MPRVSLIVTAFNRPEHVREALESVFAQAIEGYEIFVVNGGSPHTASLEVVLANYGDRITYIKQENRGVAADRNAGISRAANS